MRKFELGLSIGALAATAGILSGCEDHVSVRIPNCYDPDPFTDEHALRDYWFLGTNKVIEIGDLAYKRKKGTGELIEVKGGEETSIYTNLNKPLDELVNGRTVVIQFEDKTAYIMADITATCPSE